MIKRLRPILFFVHGTEARAIFRSVLDRIATVHPELAAIHSGVVIDGDESTDGNDARGESQSVFGHPSGVVVRSAGSHDDEALHGACASARVDLCDPDSIRRIAQKGWVIHNDDQPITIILTDSCSGSLPDWRNVCQILRHEWKNKAVGLADSLAILLAPGIQERFVGHHRLCPELQHTARAFMELNEGSHHPGDMGSKWMPHVVAVDGRLEDGAALKPSKDLRDNTVDLIYGMAALCLTDMSTFGAAQRHHCRTGGVLRVGLPVEELLAEHRLMWSRRFLDGLHSLSEEPIREAKCQDAARDWLRESGIRNGDQLLRQDEDGASIHVSMEAPGNSEFCGTPDAILRVQEKISDFWEDEVDEITVETEKQRKVLIERTRDSLRRRVGEWLHRGQTPEEVAKVLSMIRGVDQSGLAGSMASDLRSLKWEKVWQLSEFTLVVDPARRQEFKALHDELESLSGSAVTDDEEEGSSKGAPMGSAQRLLGKHTDSVDQLYATAARVLRLEEGTTAEVSLEGWTGRTISRVLPSGGTVVVAKLSDHRDAQQRLEHLRRDFHNFKGDLANEPEDPLADGDVGRRKVLIEKIDSLKPEIESQEQEVAASQESLERWQMRFEESTEHQIRCDMIRQSVDDQLALSYAVAVKRQEEADRIGRQRPRKRPFWRDFVDVVGPVVIVAILMIGALKLWMPGTTASITSVEARRVTIEESRARIDLVVHDRRLIADLPAGTWTQAEIGRILLGETVREKKLKIVKGLATALSTYLKVDVEKGQLILSDKTEGSKSNIRFVKVKTGGANRTIGFPAAEAQGSDWYATRRSFWILLALAVTSVLFIYLRFYLKYVAWQKKMAAFNAKLKHAMERLQRWCENAIAHVDEAAEQRIQMEALFGSVEAIDKSVQSAEEAMKRFSSFRKLVADEVHDMPSVLDEDGEFPKSRKFFSVMNREQVGRLLLTKDYRDQDDVNYRGFESKWDRVRLWKSFVETEGLGKWKNDLRETADRSYDFLAKFDVALFLSENPEILKEDCEDSEFLRANAKPMAELFGDDSGDDSVRHFVYNCGDDTAQEGLKTRLDHLLPSPEYKLCYEGTSAEATVVAIRPHMAARRIGFIQSGFQGLLSGPWVESEDFFGRAGADFDQIYALGGMTPDPNSAFGGDVRQWYQLISLLPAIMSNDDAKKTAEDGSACLSVAGIRLGKSVSEVLCRVAGYGVSDEEHKRIIEASRARVSSRFLRAVAELERLFNALSRSDKELNREWKKVRNDAIDSAYFAFILKACVNERLLKAEGGYFELDGHELTREVTELGAKIDAFRDNKSMPEQLKAEIRGYGQREAASKLPELNAEVYQVLSKNCGKKFLEWVRKHPALPDEESLKGWSDNHPGQWIPPGEATDNEIEDPTDEADRPWT